MPCRLGPAPTLAFELGGFREMKFLLLMEPHDFIDNFPELHG